MTASEIIQRVAKAIKSEVERQAREGPPADKTYIDLGPIERDLDLTHAEVRGALRSALDRIGLEIIEDGKTSIQVQTKGRISPRWSVPDS